MLAILLPGPAPFVLTLQKNAIGVQTLREHHP
jgi:hypothetical protein